MNRTNNRSTAVRPVSSSQPADGGGARKAHAIKGWAHGAGGGKHLFRISAMDTPDHAGFVVSIDGSAVLMNKGAVVISQKWHVAKNLAKWSTPLLVSSAITPEARIEIVPHGGENIWFSLQFPESEGSSKFDLVVDIVGGSHSFEEL